MGDELNHANGWGMMHLRKHHHPLIAKQVQGTLCGREMLHSRECHHLLNAKGKCKGTRLCGQLVIQSRECVITCWSPSVSIRAPNFMGEEWCTKGSVIIHWLPSTSARALCFVGDEWCSQRSVITRWLLSVSVKVLNFAKGNAWSYWEVTIVFKRG